MPVMIPMISVRVHRDGQNIVPPIGKPFEFTTDEVTSIKGHMFHALRRPENESIALNDTDLMKGKTVPDADDTRDANVLAKAKPKSKGARANQGGGMTDDDDDGDSL